MKKLPLIIFLIALLIACRPSHPRPAQVDWTLYKKAYAFLPQKNDSAFYYFNQVALSSRDSSQVAMSYDNMAMIQTDAGDYYGAQESLSAALKFLDENREQSRETLASVYNELGMSSTSLKNYSLALDFFDKSIHLTNDRSLKSLALNNKAFAYQKKKDYIRALLLYRQLIGTVKTDSPGYARILTNLATTAWLKDPHYPAVNQLKEALHIRQKLHDQWGLHSSYAALAAYYLKTLPDSALFYARARHVMAENLHSPDDRLKGLATLIQVLPPAEAKPYFARYQELADSIQTSRNAAKNQFALIRYNVEQGKVVNLQLQKENAEKNYQLLLGAALLVTLTGSSIAWYRQDKRRKESDKQEAILETRRKASKDVHDSLSSDIYLLMKRIRHDAALDRSWLQRQADLVYQRSRNISYELPEDGNNESFPERLGELLQSFGTDETKVSLVLNNSMFWQAVSLRNKLEIRLILKELLVNMQKHSGAGNVVIRFQIHDKERSVIYTDDGQGIPEGTKPQNGLKNAENRIKEIGGSLTFGSNEGKGLMIQLDFPAA